MVVERKCVTLSPNVNDKSRKLQKREVFIRYKSVGKKSAIGFFSFLFF